jgi:hypothetical protein
MTMHRRSVVAAGLLVTVAILCGSAHAQWGYGYYPYGYGGYGWGGWGGTLQGDVARGLGYFNMGAGVYNQQTAIARAINTDTAIRWNQYVYLSQKQATHEYIVRRNAALARDRDAYAAILKRLQDNPTAADIEKGDALNAALDQLSDPRLHSSALRMAGTPVPAKTIRDIPFRHASAAVAFSLSQLKAASEWPSALLQPRFSDERADFEKLVDEIRKEDLEKDQISHGSLIKLREVLTRLKVELAATPLQDSAENQEALKFIKTVTALTRMLEKPDIATVLAELEKIETSSLGNLLAFMHTFNLRFGPATTPRQRQVYADLYPVLDQTRDRILAEAKLDDAAAERAKKAKLSDFFSAMDLEHIEGQKKVPQPPKPAPQ